MFGFSKAKDASTDTKQEKFPGPKEIPEAVGRYMVVTLNKDPDYVWKLKGVCRKASSKQVSYCRVYDESKTSSAGIKVRDWTSLETKPELIIWEGSFNKDTSAVHSDKYTEHI